MGKGIVENKIIKLRKLGVVIFLRFFEVGCVGGRWVGGGRFGWGFSGDSSFGNGVVLYRGCFVIEGEEVGCRFGRDVGKFMG